MSNWKPTRRQFLYEFGSISMLLPFMPSLLPNAFGATAKPPFRVVFIGNRNGQKPSCYFPTNLGTMTQFAPNVFYKKLSEISGPISPVFGTAWDGLRDKFSLLSGIDNVIDGDGGHQIGTIFGAAPCVGGNGESTPPQVPWAATIDWIISQSSNFYQTPPLVTALRYNHYDFPFSYSNPTGTKAVNLPYLSTEEGVFNQAFASLTGGTVTSNPAAKRILASEQAISQMNSLSSSARLSSLDKLRLQAHVATMNALKATYVSPVVPSSCSKPTMSFYKDGDSRVKRFSNMNDIIVAAFSCDITRIACYNITDFDNTSGDYVYQHDVVSHDAGPTGTRLSGPVNAWKADRVRDLITKLDRVIEADGSTMLDNTLIIWNSESGATPVAHCIENLPIFIAGGKNIGAKLKMGYFMDYRTRPFKYYANRTDFGAAGRPVNSFFVSVMQALGLQRSEFSKYGKSGNKYGDFSPRREYGNGEYNLYTTTYDENLPFIYTG